MRGGANHRKMKSSTTASKPPPKAPARHLRAGKAHPLLTRLGHFAKRNVQILVILAVLLIALRLALPFLVKWYVNKTLDEMPEYDGEIGDVDMKLWRGAYEIENIRIVKTTGDVPVPFFSSGRVEFSVEWKALFDGALVAEIEFDRPVINFVNGPTEGTSQVGVDKPWLDVIKKLFPLDINRFQVNDGSLHYRDFYSSPKVDLEIDRIQMLATNLTNTRRYSKTLVATITADGRAFQESDLRVETRLDPSTDLPTFDLNLKMAPVSLTRLNDFAKAYGKFDFEKGTLAVAAELAASDGRLNGYVKPLLDNVSVVNLREDAKKPLQLVWEGLVGGVMRLFRNQPRDRLATKIPISGTFSNPQTPFWPVLGNILKNEFIRAFDGDVENLIDLDDAQKAPPPKEKPRTKEDRAEPTSGIRK